MDDHVSKLEHMGKETVKKLQDIHGAAIGSGIDISVPTNCINKGGPRSLGLTACWVKLIGHRFCQRSVPSLLSQRSSGPLDIPFRWHALR